MASEAEVRSEISEVPIEDRCGLDMSSYEDLPKLDGDCNGVNNKHVDDDKVQVEEEDTDLNGNGKVDPDGLYVLVSRSDSVDGDPIDCDLNVECVNKSHTLPESTVGSLNIDVEGQVGQLNDEEDEETVSVVDNCIGKVADVDVDVLQFNLYLYSKFSQNVFPYNVVGQLAVPFYQDFMVDSDNSGFMNISIGPRNDSIIKTAFLNGVEIMEVITGLGLVTEVKKPPKKHLFVVVGSVVGSVASVNVGSSGGGVFELQESKAC